METTSNPFLALLMLAGGVGLFLFGMECLVRMFRQATGPALRKAMGRVGRSQWSGWVTGTAASSLIHSAPTVVIAMGLVSAGLLKFTTTLGIVAGANFGTTLAIQVIAFDIGRYALGLVGAGVILRTFSTGKLAGHIGYGLIGFGLIFLGLNTLKISMLPFQDAGWMASAMGLLDSDSYLRLPLGVILGVVVTVLLQSSGAAISILFSLAAVGLLPDIGAVIPLLLGIQLGKVMPAIIACVGNTLESLQVAVAHVGFNVAAVVIGLLTLPLAEALVPLTSADPIRQVANYNSLLMLLTGLLVVPVAGPFGGLVQRGTAGSSRARSTPSHLDPELVPYPERALAACVQELRREGMYTRQMLDLALDGFVSLDRRAFAAIRRLDESVGTIREEVEAYIELISRRRLSPRQVQMLQHVARMTNSLKRIGDHVGTMVELTREKIACGLWFSDEDMNQLLDLSLRTSEMLSLTLDSLDPELDDPRDLAKEILRQRSAYRKASRAVRADHNGRLPEAGGEGHSALMYIHFVTLLDKVVSHVKEIARQEQKWSWQLKEHKLVIREPEAPPPRGIPDDAIIDPDFQTAVSRLLPGRQSSRGQAQDPAPPDANRGLS